MSDNATSFGRQAATYAKGRPGYPPALYDWIAAQSPGRTQVWDVGTGSGQAARALVERFDQVHATDVSEAQIAAAGPHPNIAYHTAPAESSGLTGQSVDAITSATAVHWFADAPFWAEVGRVGRVGALVCAWTYQLPRALAAIQRSFLDPVLAAIDPFWATGNRICMAGYSAENLNCPLPVFDTPKFDAGGLWTAIQLADFAESWSAHLRAREAGLTADLADLRAALLRDHGDTPIEITLPLSVLAARVG